MTAFLNFSHYGSSFDITFCNYDHAFLITPCRSLKELNIILALIPSSDR